MTEFCVALFYSNSHALRAEKLAKKAGFKVKVIPTPRHLSSDCGFALRCDEDDVPAIQGIMDGDSVEYDRIEKVG